MNTASKTDLSYDQSVDSTLTGHTTYLAKGGSISFIGLLFRKVFAMATEVFLARTLGVANFGSYSLARTIVQIPNFATNLGMPQGVVRFGTIYRSKSELDNQKGLLNGSLLIVTSIGFLVSFIIYVNSYQIASWFDKPDLEMLIKILTWILAPSGLTAIVSSYARSQQRIGIDVLVRIFFQPFTILLLCLLFVGLFDLGNIGAAYAFLLAAILNSLLGLTFLLRVFYPVLKKFNAKYYLKHWLRFSIPTFLLGVSALLLRYTSRLLLGYFGKYESVGVFTAASALADNLTLFMLVFNPIFAPMVVSLYERGLLESFAQNFKMISRWQLTLTLPLAIITILFAKELMLLFGGDFQVAANVLIILVLAQLVNVGTGPVGMILQMTGHQDLEFYNGVFVFLINLILGLFMVPRWDALGAGMATAVSLAVIHLIRLFEIYKLLGILPYDRAIIKCLIATTISVFIVKLFFELIVIDRVLIKLSIGTSLTLLVYLAILVVLKPEESDKNLWRMVLKKANGLLLIRD